MTTVGSKVFFDGIPVAPFGSTSGVVFTVTTFYIPIPYAAGASVRGLELQGDGTAVATATVQHTDFETELDGSEVVSRTVGSNVWQTDTAIGTLSIAASTGPTGAARVAWSNQASRKSRIVLVVTTGGRIRGAMSGIQ